MHQQIKGVNVMYELAENYYYEYVFWNSLDEFAEANNVEDLNELRRLVLKVYKVHCKEYKLDRIQREFKKNEYCTLYNETDYCIIHKSPKYEGYYQCSLFNSNGAYGDFNECSLYKLAIHLIENYPCFNFKE